MPKTAIVRARVEEDVKRDTEQIFKELGFTMSDAINIFLRRCRVRKGIPFELEIPNAETIQAIEDSRNGIGLQKFDTIEEMFEALEKE